MNRIFVSFRDESGHSAGRLGHLLGNRFGPDEVFLAGSADVGADPATATADAPRQCAACVVVIDPSWTADTGRRPDESDPVVQQVRAVLERRVGVLPVLVNGAQPPPGPTAR